MTIVIKMALAVVVLSFIFCAIILLSSTAVRTGHYSYALLALLLFIPSIAVFDIIETTLK